MSRNWLIVDPQTRAVANSHDGTLAEIRKICAAPTTLARHKGAHRFSPHT